MIRDTAAPEPISVAAGTRRLVAALALLGLWWGLMVAGTALAETGGVVAVIDDRGRTIQLDQPAQRIVSLAPHLTELLFAVGAGDRIVATVAHADFPPAAQDLPRVGTATQLDLERIVAMRPDLLIVWDSGSPRATLERLERLGLSLYYSEPSDFDGIATNLRRLGLLAGQGPRAEQAATEFLTTINALEAEYANRPPVPLFYQVWDQPLMTVNDSHLIGKAIRLCGGRNIFGQLEALVPRPGPEAVLVANPEAIVSGGPGEDREDWLQAWEHWTQLTAVRRGNLFFIPPSLIQRHTPRIAEGTRLLCEALETARARRPEAAR